jgi:hypothetical protein
MIEKTVSIKNDALDALSNGALRDKLPDPIGNLGFFTAVGPFLLSFLQAASRRERPTARVVNHLGINVPRTAKNRQSRSIRSSENFLSNSLFPFQPSLFFQI